MNSRKYKKVKVIVILSILFLFAFLVKPKVMRIWQMKQMEKDFCAQYDKEMSLVNNQEMIRKDLKQVSEKVVSYFRNNNFLLTTEIIEAILQASKASGLVVQTIQPATRQMNQAINTNPIHLILLGKFAQLVNFFEILSHYSLPIVLKDFSLRSLPSELVQMDMQFLGVYIGGFGNSKGGWSKMQNSDFKLNLRDPFEVPAVNSKVNNDFASIYQMKYVGYLQQDNFFWGFLMLPSGKTIHVSQGDILGVEKMRVVSLDINQIKFENSFKISISPFVELFALSAQ